MHHKSTVVLVAVLALAPSLVLLGCGTDDKGSAGTTPTSTSSRPTTTETATATAKAPAKVVLLEKGFRQKDDQVFFGLVLKNTSSTLEADDITVSVNALDATGNVLGTDDSKVGVIPPGEKFNVGGEVDPGKAHAKSIDVLVKTGSSAKAEHPVPKVTNVRVEDQGYGGVTIRAEVENILDTPLSAAADLFAVLRDHKGKIIGGTNSYPDTEIASGRKAGVEFDFLTGYAGLATADVSADNEIAPSTQ